MKVSAGNLPTGPNRFAVMNALSYAREQGQVQENAETTTSSIPEERQEKAELLPEDTDKKTNLSPRDTDKQTNRLSRTEKKRTSILPKDADKQTGRLSKDTDKKTGLLSKDTDKTAGLLSKSKDTSKNFKMKASTPDNSVGQLASELARAETRLDVQQVSSKATRALMSLKMASTACEEDDKKKIAQEIRRMEKLLKRIQKKLKHLNKEEQLNEQRKQAVKRQELEKARQIQKELQARRTKRRRDERNYALKEMAKDGQSEAKEMTESMLAAASAANPATSISAGTAAYMETMSMADFSSGFSGMEGGSVDISI